MQVSAAAQADRDLDVPELERFGQCLLPLEGVGSTWLERLADLHAEVVVNRAAVAQHDPLAGVDTPLPGRLYDLERTVVANGALAKPWLPHTPEYRHERRASVCRCSALATRAGQPTTSRGTSSRSCVTHAPRA